jgi:predicted nuclease with TOPRIM domain
MIYRFLSIFSILGLIGYLFLFDQEYQAFNTEHDTLNKEHDTLNKEHDTLNKEYDTLFKKANSITKVSINNINHINNLYKEISFCQTTPKILGNESFDQPIPVFYQENYKQEFVIKNSDTLLSFFCYS